MDNDPRFDGGASSQLSLREILGFLIEYRRSMVACCLVPMLLGLIYSWTATRSYTARAQILLEARTPNLLNEAGNSMDRALDSPEVESQIAVLRSEKIALAVVKQLKLMQDPEFLGPLPPESAKSPAESPDGYMRSRHVIFAFNSGLDVRRNGFSYAIDISYSSQDPDKSALIANAIGHAYVEDQLQTRADAVRAGGRWLEQRIEQLRRQMNEAALRVQRFKVKRDYRIVDQTGKNGASRTEANRDITPEEVERETLEELESRAAAFKRIYESYLQAYTESLQRQSYPVANARVITPATRPLMASWPKNSLILAFALLLGLLAGFAQALLRHHFRTDTISAHPT